MDLFFSPGVGLFLLLFIILVFGTHAYAGVIGASWVPSRRRDLARILAASQGFQGKVIYDLGCGEGCVMRAFAKQYPHAQVIGYELSLPMYLWCACANFFSPACARLHTVWKNIYHTHLHDADLVYCFLMPHAMRQLAPFFKSALKPGTLVITYAFPLPGWHGECLKSSDRELPIYRYTVPS